MAERLTGRQIDEQYWPEPGEECSNSEHDHVRDSAARAGRPVPEAGPSDIDPEAG